MALTIDGIEEKHGPDLEIDGLALVAAISTGRDRSVVITTAQGQPAFVTRGLLAEADRLVVDRESVEED